MNRLSGALLFVLGALLPLAAADQPLTPAQAPGKMTLPPGFRVQLFAGEPDIMQPIAFTFDDRGRLWVVECLSYPQWTDKPTGTDRVSILEDTNGDGVFDTKKVFYAKGANLSGIQLGFGGVWLCATPRLLFIPDRNGDDVPDGESECVLDGWDLKAKHNVFNALTWGPDGWLWGCNGILSHSNVGKPGAKDDARVRINCGVWRYHPMQQRFEAVAHGTTNPWGLDFDDYGEAFITNCVIHHLFHVIPGAHYQRMHGQGMNPHSYSLIKSVAPYLHWAGGDWTTSRGGQGAHSDAGGGHAHSGAAIYLGEHWPAEYRNTLLTCNIHGSRLNRDVLKRHGSGYRSERAPDFLFANDPWFRGVAVHQGPDGMYVCDWTDTGECHNYVVADKTNGRMYKITHEKEQPWRGDVSKLPDRELVQLQSSGNEWLVRHARRVLQERAVANQLDATMPAALAAGFASAKSVPQQLRYLWALHAVGAPLPAVDAQAPEAVLAWHLRLRGDQLPAAVNDFRTQAVQLARSTSSRLVLLHLASLLQRLPVGERLELALALAGRAELADDANVPLLLWYGLEPALVHDLSHTKAKLAEWLNASKIPLLREYTARRLGAHKEFGLDALLAVVSQPTTDLAVVRDVLVGLQAALSGQRAHPQPAGWTSAYERCLQSDHAEIKQLALTLAVVFDDARAFARLEALVREVKAPAPERTQALATLVYKQKPTLVPLLHELLGDPALRAAAIRGLGAFADPNTPTLLLKHYPTFTEAERADVVQTLASRPAFALALLDAIDRNALPRRDVSAFTIRQLANLKNAEVSAKLTKVWGEVRPANAQRTQQTAKFKKLLTTDYLRSADARAGQALFVKHCAACHQLFGQGGAIGPDLTGSQRANLDYVLENVLDPNAVVAKEYQVIAFELNNGRVINGIIKQETEQALVVQTPNEVLTLPKKEIAGREQSKVSMMPEGLFDKLTDLEVRDLVAYLARREPLPQP
jgi:putative membrane-bound dehydrogenase-like protein